MGRDLAEGDEAWRQIIPYVIVQVGDRVLSYARTPRGSESRLHGFRSIGVGGHVNPPDLPGGLDAVRRSSVDTLAQAARREIDEETQGISDPQMRFMGYLRDDDSAVARVHVGFVYRLRATSADLSQEGKMTDPRLLSWDELRAERERYEGWSRLIIETEAGR
jgi:predicted NUDIX family phosphoesterase